MSSAGLGETRDYGFADKALALRERAGLTQRALAALLEVSGRAIHNWEAGLAYPGADNLKRLIALHAGRGVFSPGREEDEAAALWEAVRAHAPRRVVPFDRGWFASLHGGADGNGIAALHAPVPATGAPGQDSWGEVPEVAAFFGRDDALATLSRWLLDDHCRLVGVLGMGGVGKTLLAARIVREVASRFDVVYWRSLRNAPPVEEWLAGAIAALSAAQVLPAGGFTARVALLVELLQRRRGLLVLDNLETILEPGAPEARYRDGYAGYGEVLRRVGGHVHQSCLLLTGREAPPELAPLAGERAPIRTLRLGGLGPAAGRALLQAMGLRGDDAAWEALVARYGGNPLALRMVGDTIDTVFEGDIAAFLAQEAAVFGGIRQLLDEQVGRLSPLEREIGTWLAAEREPVGFAELVADLGPGVARGEVLGAVEALQRRSLLERAGHGTFTLQPVVLEYATTRLVAAVAREIEAGEPTLLVSHALLKAQAKDYVRHSQERLIALPLLHALSRHGGAERVERQLLVLLETWRGQSAAGQRYGPGNVINLLRLLRGDLRGVDLSRLSIRQAYLQGVEAQDASLRGAQLAEVSLAEAFSYPTALALSADGAHLAMSTSTGEVRLWRVADRTLLVAVQGHSGPTMGVALSADGRLLASGSLDGTIRLWDAESGQPLATLQGHVGQVWRVALSGDGRLLASGGDDGTVRLWEARPAGRLLATLEGHTGAVQAVTLSRDGHLVASGGADGTVRLWEARPAHPEGAWPAGRLLATLEGHTGMVWGVALSGDGHLVASGGADGTVRLWEALPPGGRAGRLLATLEGHTGMVCGVALTEDGRLVASGSYDRTVRLWEAAPASGPAGHLLGTLQGQTAGIQAVALSADGGVLASGSQDGSLRLWEVPGGQLLATLQGQTGAVWGVALSADGGLLASSSQDGTVRLWEAASGSPERLLATLQGQASGVRRIALSADGRLLASGNWDGTIRLWEAESGQQRAVLPGHSGGVLGVALSGDGHLVASGGGDEMVRLWEAASGGLLATLQGHTGVVWGVALSGDGCLVASGGADGTVRLWEAPGGLLLATLEGHTSGVQAVALSADGGLVAGGSFDGTIRLWEAPTGRLRATLQGPRSAVFSVALSGDGRLVASGTFDGTVKLWEARSGHLLITLEGPGNGPRCVALSGDGCLVVCGSGDGTVTLWDTTPTGGYPVPGGAVRLRTLRGDRRYERLDITDLTGLTEAQRAALLMLGAVEQAPTRAAQAGTSGVSALSAVAALVPPPRAAPVPAAALDAARPPTNLAPTHTTFVGRTSDVATLAQMLDYTAATGTRLLTLTGVAGCGKTRLALAVAEAVRDTYPDGAWLVELAPLPASPAADPTAVAAATLSAMGISEQPRQALLDTLVVHLQARRLLLVLDNCEHLVEPCAALAARLLGACSKLRILATSQQSLGIVDETVWPVPALTLPDAPEGAPTEAVLNLLDQAEAVQLFLQRAQAVQPGFVLSAETAASVAGICRRLDGLPLAIELAAARLNVLPLEAILARLDDRFRLLRGGGRTSTDRHQALQATMDWSYGLLEPAEQAVLRRLAVFVGGWDLAAAEVVCADEAVAAEVVLELLDALLERSLVYSYRTQGMPRYGMLETVRQYGAQQLERAGETAQVRDRHLGWSVALAEQAAPALLGREQRVWLARLDREHDNLRAALHWALDRGLSTPGLRVVGGLGRFWRNRGHLSEGRRWLAALLALPADGDRDAAMAARASALECAAWLMHDKQDFAKASALFAQSGALEQEDLPPGLLISIAMEAQADGDYARATGLLEQSLARHRALGGRDTIMGGGLGLSLTRLALVLGQQGDYARATALYEECLALMRMQEDRDGIGIALLGLGDVARDQGDTARVRNYCEDCLALFRELGHPWAVGFSLNNLALAANQDGDLALAASLVQESAAIFRSLNAGPSLAEVLVTAGHISGAHGEVAAARAALAEALRLAWAEGPRLVVAAALEELGVQATQQGHAEEGVRLLAATAALRRAMGTPTRPADRPALEGALAAARVSLGETAFSGTWAMGQTLPLEQIVAIALAAPEGPTTRGADGSRHRTTP